MVLAGESMEQWWNGTGRGECGAVVEWYWQGRETLRRVIPVVCVSNEREENVVKQHN